MRLQAMGIVDRAEALWRHLRADSPAGARARRRAAAAAAMAAFLLVLLASAGLLEIIILAAGVVAGGAAAAGVVLLARRHRQPLGDRVRDVARHSAALAARAGHGCSRGSRQALRHARAVPSRLRIPAIPRVKSAPIDRRRDALRLNVAGVQLRRDGAYLEAAEEHRLAAALFRELGDRRSEALTLNNLALALDRAGDATALDLFEEAATILGELGEEQHEGQVIANLGMAYRRRGREEQSAEVLELALGKLSPDSQEYRKVEDLRRAS
jgi:tetratricopeptide (TPR) repeat protein